MLVSDRLAGYGFILIAAICWGLLGPVARVALGEGVRPLEVAFWRAVIGGSLFAMHVLAMHVSALGGRASDGRRRLIRSQHVLVVVAFGLVGVSLFYSAYQFAVEEGGAALASVLLYTAPGWVVLMGWWGLGERLTVLKGAAVTLTLMGVAGIAVAGTGSVRISGAAVGWGLAAGISYALYYPFGKRYFDAYVPAAIFAAALPVGAVGLMPLVRFGAKSGAAWGALLFIGVVSTYVAYLAYAAGLQRLEASRASIVATVEPVVAAAVAHAWWGERFGAWGYVGAALVIVAAFLAAAAPAVQGLPDPPEHDRHPP